MRIALAGNPNSGKTTMFNALTGRNEKVGNWAGVTVEKKEYPIKKNLCAGKDNVVAVDLPGAYSMSPFTSEESVTRDYVKNENPDAIIIGEVWEDASDKIAYSKRREYLLGGELDSVMNYPLKDAIISYAISGNAFDLLKVLHSLIDHYPKETLDCLMNILGTHDTKRILTVLGEKHCSDKQEMAKSSANLTKEEREKAITRLKLAVVLQYTMPGVPCIYYGDENGMEGFVDPFCRKCFDWNNLNVELINFYKKLGAIRNKYKEFFKDARFEPIFCEKGLFLYKRRNNNEEIYVYTNNSSNSYSLNLNGKFIELISDVIIADKFEVKPYSYGIFHKIEKKNSLNS